LALLPYFIKVKFDFNPALLRKMLSYSLPLLLLGIAGIMNQTFDKIIFTHLFEDQDTPGPSWVFTEPVTK
jgi:O-antigen/teichoic acid export membrane protein